MGGRWCRALGPGSIHGFKDESGDWIPGLNSHTSQTYILGYHDGLDGNVSTPAA
jgi:hypothetical protein